MPECTRQQTHDAIQLVEEYLDNFYQDCALMSAIVTGQNDEPKTFQEAWYHDDQENWKKWRTIIWKEFYNVYCFVNPNTNRIILSRDIKWLSRRYGEERNVKPSFMSIKWDDISNDEENGNDEQKLTKLI